jgi:hypothetical protein
MTLGLGQPPFLLERPTEVVVRLRRPRGVERQDPLPARDRLIEVFALGVDLGELLPVRRVRRLVFGGELEPGNRTAKLTLVSEGQADGMVILGRFGIEAGSLQVRTIEKNRDRGR